MAFKHGYVPPSKTKRLQVGHFTIELRDAGADGQTFALIPGEADEHNKFKPLFTGHLSREMAGDLRKASLAIGEMLDAAELQGRV
ncbi:hypothetical protein AB3Y40_06680 [Yoonia sp. R2331]|uniref:hypothetical protein n=1 Tax=Yoonia sp. R2331 TaxID=3237238 RepID=UPI0034E54FA7